MQKVDITVQEIKFFLKEMQKGNVDDMQYKKALINSLINKVYLYDDNLTIIFNSQNKPYKEKIPLIEEIEKKFEAGRECSYKVRPAPPHHKNNITYNISCILFLAHKRTKVRKDA